MECAVEKIIKNTSYNHVTSYRTRAMSLSSFCYEYVCVIFLFSPIPLCNTGIPNLWDRMPDDLRWNWCNNNRNKVHNKSDALESSPTPTPLLPSPWKSCLPQNQTLMSKSVGTGALEKSLSAAEENVFLSYLLLTDLRIKFTWDRLTKESKRKFNNVHMGETQENWVTPQNGWSPPLNTIFS